MFFLVLFGTLNAQTTIPSGNVNGNWTVANSPYQVQGLIVVQDGQTLTIEPGTAIEFATTGRLRIKGNVLASGTALDPITFTAQNQVNGWQSIFLDSVNATSDSTIFEHCTIEYGKGTGLFRIINFSKLRIENCILQNGQAFSGGCVYMANSDAIFKNNLIINNSAQTGGGAFVLGAGTPVFSGNTISNNVAGDYGGAFRVVATSNAIYTGNTISNNQALTGGAFSMTSYCTLTVDGNVFDSNQSTYDGAVFWGGNEFLTVTNNSFTNNISGEDGGVAFFQSYTNSNFSGNYYSGNSAVRGGAFYLMSNSQVHFDNEIFHANNASSSGSIIYATGASSIRLKNSKMSNNVANVGIVLSGNGTVTTKNCIFANNQGIAVSVSSSTAIHTNTHFVNNEASPSVGVLVNSSGSNSTFTNCIFKGNSGGGAFYNGYIQYNGWNPSSASFINCNVEGGLASIDSDGGPPPVYINNIDADPQFVAPSAGAGVLFDGLNANWQFGITSPCFNAGTPDTTGLFLPATDLAGGLRIVLDTVDIGAYEIFLEAQVLAASSSSGICSGDTAVILVQAGGVDPLNYQWQFNGVDIVGETNDSLAIYGAALSAGTYRCIVSNGYGIDTSNLISIAHFIPPTLSSLGADFSICAGDEAVLYGESGPYTYTWNGGLSATDSLVIDTVGSYFYAVIDTNGCSAQSDTLAVSENPLPIINIVGDTLCQGESFIIYANQGYTNYNWNNGLSLEDSLIVASTGSYFVEVEDANGCINSDTAHVLFNPLPVVNLGIDQEICPGDSVMFIAGNGFTSYDWNNGFANTNSIYSSTVGAWFVAVLDTNGCASSDTVNLTFSTISSGVDNVTACESYSWIDGNTYTSNNNSAIFTLSNSQGCDSVVTLNLTINSSTTSSDLITACESYTWMDGITYTANNTTATYILTNAQGCDSIIMLDLTILSPTTGTETVSTCNDFTWIDGNTYSSSTTASYTITGGAASGCDSIVTLDLTIDPLNTNVTNNDPELVAETGMSSYQWLDCNNGFAPITGETSATFIATQNGLYAVQVELNGCSDTSACMAIDQVNLLELGATTWTIYPNPTDDEVILSFQEVMSKISIEIINPVGQLIRKESFTNLSEIELVLGEEAGLYFIRLSVDDKEDVIPVVKL
ncbi:MAG: right-handed parallel beta-helix repeat-containing protein [Crocinitomicaceae bacterium]